eukprot:COSAG04_NODE_413_length_14740_cov_85.508572_7_plen_51_part_00
MIWLKLRGFWATTGTIDEAEFGKLLVAMSLDVQPGQFAAIDKVRPNILFF